MVSRRAGLSATAGHSCLTVSLQTVQPVLIFLAAIQVIYLPIHSFTYLLINYKRKLFNNNVVIGHTRRQRVRLSSATVWWT